MAVLGKSEQLAGARFLVRNRFHFDEALTKEVLQIGSHAIVIPAIGKFREILPGDSAEFPKLHHRCDFGVPQAIGSPAQFVDGASFSGARSRAVWLEARRLRRSVRCLLTNLIGFGWIAGVGLPPLGRHSWIER